MLLVLSLEMTEPFFHSNNSRSAVAVSGLPMFFVYFSSLGYLYFEDQYATNVTWSLQAIWNEYFMLSQIGWYEKGLGEYLMFEFTGNARGFTL